MCHTEFESRHLEMDHILPRARGGQDWADNFQLLCSSCNRIKTTKTQDQAKSELAKRRGIDLSPFLGDYRQAFKAADAPTRTEFAKLFEKLDIHVDWSHEEPITSEALAELARKALKQTG